MYARRQLLTFSSLPAMKILDPHLKDGVHEWRDGKRFVKEGDKLYLEGTDTLAGRSVHHPFSILSYPLTQSAQCRHTRQVCPQLRSLHRVHARRLDQVRDLQPRQVPRHREQEGHAPPGRRRRPRRPRPQRPPPGHLCQGQARLGEAGLASIDTGAGYRGYRGFHDIDALTQCAKENVWNIEC